MGVRIRAMIISTSGRQSVSAARVVMEFAYIVGTSMLGFQSRRDPFPDLAWVLSTRAWTPKERKQPTYAQQTAMSSEKHSLLRGGFWNLSQTLRPHPSSTVQTSPPQEEEEPGRENQTERPRTGGKEEEGYTSSGSHLTYLKSKGVQGTSVDHTPGQGMPCRRLQEGRERILGLNVADFDINSLWEKWEDGDPPFKSPGERPRSPRRVKVMPSALGLLLLAGLLSLSPVHGSHQPGRRRHKDVYLGEHAKHKYGGRIDYKLKKSDSTKSLLIKSEQLLRIEDHDFTMRPGFGGSAIPVGIDVQVESIDSISEVNMSRTFDARLVKKIWVPDVFFVHSKRSFIHDTTMENIMLRVYPDGNILYSVRVTVTALCSMDFSRFPLDTQNCSLELESCWYNRLYINFLLRRHIFFFMLQTYFPTMLMVMLSWVSFWIDRRAVPARVSLGITTVLTMSTIITGVSASMPQVSYVKAVDIYLWTSFLFVFLSVIEYAAVNYFTTVEEMKKLTGGKLPASFNATQAMAFDGCFHDNDIDLPSFPEIPNPDCDRRPPPRSAAEPPPTEGTRLCRKRSFRSKINFVMSNSYMIDSYSRILFPLAYLLFNIIYWSMYS
ncbi:hypothetical protein Z043_110705 [Scleropages formosus]|uniref:Gamma-aminobutyric acid receptor subunit rho-3-like n=1 Tax=Scleropages formosus TaxID=113540 RepID=A0A0P7YS44_SCLFO|nr:hypothetical protein Z043_110705 [Scleropages formosus]